MQVLIFEHNKIYLENLLSQFWSLVLILTGISFSVDDNEKCQCLELGVTESYHRKHRGPLLLPAWTENWSGELAGQPYLPQAQRL